ncbi:MAG: hypothetical protein AB1505_31775 [Candidatus Latescibacterota bacterium]
MLQRSRQLEETEKLLADYHALEARFETLQRQKETGSVEAVTLHAGPAEPALGPPRLTAKAEGARRRQTFVRDAGELGVVLHWLGGTRYGAPNLPCVGIASATESEEYRDRWFLGLAPGTYDGFVLLCEDRRGVHHRFIASQELAASVLPALSRDRNGQIEFHVTREDRSFYLDIPGRPHVALDGYREQFGNLKGHAVPRATDMACEGHTGNMARAAEEGDSLTNTRSGRKGGHRELGRRGNENLRDYLLPVIGLMVSRLDYQKAFAPVADKLDVRYNTVSAQCTRALRISTEEFAEQVRGGHIAVTLKAKFPDRHDEIDTALGRR